MEIEGLKGYMESVAWKGNGNVERMKGTDLTGQRARPSANDNPIPVVHRLNHQTHLGGKT